MTVVRFARDLLRDGSIETVVAVGDKGRYITRLFLTSLPYPPKFLEYPGLGSRLGTYFHLLH